MPKLFSNLIKSILILIILGLFLFFSHQIQDTYTSIAIANITSPDAIAIRVIPNSSHYSALRWYQEQGFTGSPQSLIIDGYEAVRDGRTVYVNAANAIGDNLYTNIYLISYNQDSEQATVDIFSQILNHWKFNTNITGAGNCSISSISCLSQDDCLDNYICDSNQNKCVLENSINCLIDSDCPDNLFCDSDKAEITRDTKRLSDLAE
ncbi:MAG: hypothetical protein U9R14_01820, partial [Patescibacteria group bacterium]|nr:hypothetical protein [Patescibacteria group bacterium]